ncbi:unnamed protein product [Sphenostylis stenocarpa]|uniref:Uncharacterized protein n=1 Tax=Sphenostylis stenocarpa TaxID=92480 RepID=A0AA86TF41_9FABA|nr:unnamed protein product [Sphenostylis stenocarpa]
MEGFRDTTTLFWSVGEHEDGWSLFTLRGSGVCFGGFCRQNSRDLARAESDGFERERFFE